MIRAAYSRVVPLVAPLLTAHVLRPAAQRALEGLAKLWGCSVDEALHVAITTTYARETGPKGGT